jgi:hypothetical protein
MDMRSNQNTLGNPINSSFFCLLTHAKIVRSEDAFFFSGMYTGNCDTHSLRLRLRRELERSS